MGYSYLHRQFIQTTAVTINDIKHYLQILKTSIMNNLRNKVQLIGFIGQAPEIKTLENGNKLAKFSIATNETYKDKEGKKVDNTQWHNVTAWGNTATLIEKYVTKGQELALEGKLQNRKYDDKNGVTHYVTDIIANEIQFLGKAKA